MQDLSMAQHYAGHLIKKGWHSAPYERRGSIYMQQSAFTTSLIVSYARPFTKSKGWPSFPKEFMNYDEGARSLHEKLMNLRHQVYAHSDSSQHSIRPFQINDNQFVDIVGAPFLRLSKAECELVIRMINGIQSLLSPRLKLLQSELADESNVEQSA
jgi:hypothetical protein